MWSGLPFPPPEGPPDPVIEPASPALAGRFFTTAPPGKPNLPPDREGQIYSYDQRILQDLIEGT